MRTTTRFILSGTVLCLSACGPRPPASDTARATSAAAADDSLLKELAREDVASRSGQTIARTDEERVKLVIAALGRGEVNTPADKFNAALVLQHSPMTFCEKKLVAVSPDNYLLAHHLAVASMEGGFADAKFLVPRTIDRYLSMTEGYQKYGTNRFINQETGQEELAPIDRATTDAERAKYDVEPLAVLLKQFPEAKRKGKRTG